MLILTNLFWIVAGFALLYYGAEFLVKGSSRLAISLGLSPLVVGLTIVAFGTSAPELAVSLGAAQQGKGGLALGNVVGSNICNFALVLGLCALLKPLPISAKIIKFDMPVLLLASAVSIGFFLTSNSQEQGFLARWEGLLLTLAIVAYVVRSIRKSRREDRQIPAELGADLAALPDAPKPNKWQILSFAGLVILGLGLLIFGSDLLVKGGVAIAELLGVPDALIGLSLVAFGTSLPEIATSVVGVLRGEKEMIIGNAVGSCIFNLLAVIGITGLVFPFVVAQVAPTDLWIMLGVTMLTLVLMRSGKLVARLEGLVLLGTYVAYLIYLANAY